MAPGSETFCSFPSCCYCCSCCCCSECWLESVIPDNKVSIRCSSGSSYLAVQILRRMSVQHWMQAHRYNSESGQCDCKRSDLFHKRSLSDFTTRLLLEQRCRSKGLLQERQAKTSTVTQQNTVCSTIRKSLFDDSEGERWLLFLGLACALRLYFWVEWNCGTPYVTWIRRDSNNFGIWTWNLCSFFRSFWNSLRWVVSKCSYCFWTGVRIRHDKYSTACTST